MQSSTQAGIETLTITPIPEDARFGRARDLFTIWFGGNLTLLCVATGVLGTTVYGLTVWLTVAALLLGNTVGGVVMALHAAQGPRMGVPQMLQTRAQFGSYGSLLVVVIVIVMYVGFIASSLALDGEALAGVIHLNDTLSIVLLGLFSAVASTVGYQFIHMLGRLCTVAAVVFVTLGLILVLTNDTVRSSAGNGSFTWSGFMATVSVGALWQIAYAPYVSDYSRYLPRESGSRTAFWATLSGTVLGTLLLTGMGALVGAGFPKAGPIDQLTEPLGRLGPLVMFVFATGAACTNSISLYCGALSTITAGQTLAPRWRPRAATRAMVSVVLFLISLIIALTGKNNFLDNFTNFLLLLLCVLIPWTAINLVDYYVVKKGDYNIAALYLGDGGEYGRFNWVAIVCYFIGIAVQVPFLSTTPYTGPIAHTLNGVDLSWLVGLAVVAPLYYFLMRRTSNRTLPASLLGHVAVDPSEEVPA